MQTVSGRPPPQKKWTNVAMDLIMELPVSTNGYDAVFDRMTKMAHLEKSRIYGL